MWPVFFLSFALAGAFLYVPGFFFFRGLGFGTAPSLCLSPAASLLIYCLLGVAYERLGVWASWRTMVPVTLALCLMLGIVAVFVRHRLLGNGVGAGVRGTEGADESRGEGVACLTIPALVPFFLMALAVGMYVFVLPLDGPDSFAQNWDNAFHLNAIAQFLRTGNYSAFSMGAWQPGEVAPVADVIGYYPASWSILVALVDSVTSTSLPCAVNAANFALLSLVFPSSMCFLTYVLFGGSRTLCRAAAVVTPLFVAFPWMFVEYGSLNPNLAGMSLSPLVVGSFILLGRRLLGGVLGLQALFALWSRWSRVRRHIPAQSSARQSFLHLSASGCRFRLQRRHGLALLSFPCVCTWWQSRSRAFSSRFGWVSPVCLPCIT